MDNNPEISKDAIKSEIYKLLNNYFQLVNTNNKFVPDKSKILYAEAIYDEEEIKAILDSLLDGWLGLGEASHKFEEEIARFLGCKDAVFVNSGSSANLLAVSALCSPQLKRGLNQGDEIITPAVTFPTTINPIIQNGLVPVLVDCKLKTCNIDTDLLKSALSEKTRGIMIPHMLGNPNDMDTIMEFASVHNLFVVEDCCDALGAQYKNRQVGTFGTFGTFSFYAAHHMTTGEGGAVVSNDVELSSVVRSLRDWGRVAWCPECKKPLDTTYECPHRFEPISDSLPKDYDRRYTYVNIGYNLKPLELQAAMGLIQLKRLPSFIRKREENFRILYEIFSKYELYFYMPEVLSKAKPSWFAFPITVKENAPFTRHEIVEWLEKHNISTRLMFAGNIILQPAYKKTKLRIVGDLKNTNVAMQNSFFIGVHPRLNEEAMIYIVKKIENFLKEHS